MYRYGFHVGDYKSHTHHLSPMDDLTYRRLLDLYYLHEHAISRDVSKAARDIGLPRRVQQTQRVLEEFFTETEDGWHNKRADRELAEYYKSVERNRKNGKLGGRPRTRKPTGIIVGSQSVSDGNPDGLVPSAHCPTPTTQPPEVQSVAVAPISLRVTRTRLAEKPGDVSDPLWVAFLDYRKRLPG
jgi:uncharacterized protein YdaU (DUF1376 family)